MATSGAPDQAGSVTSPDVHHEHLRRSILTFGDDARSAELTQALARLLRDGADGLEASFAVLCLLSAERTHAELILEFGPPPPVSHLGSTPPFVEAGEPWPGVRATEGPPPPPLARICEAGEILRDASSAEIDNPEGWGRVGTRLGCPIPGPERSRGAILLGRGPLAPAFSDAATVILTSIAAQISQRIEQARLEEQTRAHARREEALAQVAEALIGSSDFDAVFARAAGTLRRILDCDGVRIWRLDPVAHSLDLEASLGIAGDRKDMRMPADLPGSGEAEALEGSEIVASENLSARPESDAQGDLRAAGMRSGACCPMGTPRKRYGAICVYFRGYTELSEASARFLKSVADLVAGGLERRQAFDELRQAQKLDAVGRLAGGIAHDFNNLLTVITGYVDIATARIGEDHPASRPLAEVALAAERATELTAKLLTFSRHQKQDPRPLEVSSVVGGMMGFIQRLIGEGITYEVRIDENLPVVRADRGSLEQVLLNLFVNARDAIGETGTITLRAVAVEKGTAPPVVGGMPLESEHVALLVSDTGCGMPPEILEQIFEPFFTTKEPGAGTGLGLASAYATVRQAGGEIRVASRKDEGTTIAVLLPTATGAMVRPERKRLVVRGGTETILIVEDRRAIRDLARATLEALGYTVVEAGDGVEALTVAEAHDGPIDLLVTDLIMPRMGGVELAQTLGERRPGVRVLYVSGYPGTDLSSRPGAVPVLRKPFTVDDLGYRVREALDT